jgi:hypothetical protein
MGLTSLQITVWRNLSPGRPRKSKRSKVEGALAPQDFDELIYIESGYLFSAIPTLEKVMNLLHVEPRRNSFPVELLLK